MKKKRSKRSRLRGRRTVGYGARKKHRGKGSRGGKGFGGTGKRAGQFKTYVLRYKINELGKRGFTSIKKTRNKFKEKKIINLSQIQELIETFLDKKIAKKTPEGIEINLKNYKVLGRGKLNRTKDLGKLIIKADSFSKKAKEKLKSSNITIITPKTAISETATSE